MRIFVAMMMLYLIITQGLEVAKLRKQLRPKEPPKAVEAPQDQVKFQYNSVPMNPLIYSEKKTATVEVNCKNGTFVFHKDKMDDNKYRDLGKMLINSANYIDPCEGV